MSETTQTRAIPVIDLTSYRDGSVAGRREVAEAVGAACRSVGFRPSGPTTPAAPREHQSDRPSSVGAAVLISSSSMRVSGSAMPVLNAWFDSSS